MAAAQIPIVPFELRYLQPMEIIRYFTENESDKVTHHELINYFRPLLEKSSQIGQNNHALLKEYTKELVVIKKLKGREWKIFQNCSKLERKKN